MDSLLRKYIDIIEAAAPAPAATVPGTLKAGDGSTVVDGSGAPVQAGTQPAPAAAAPAAAAPTAADQEDADMGAAMTANAQAAPVQTATPAPTAPTAADQEDADMGAAMTANAQAANGVNTAGQNVTMPNGINPETGTPTTPQQAATPAPAAAPNYDTMPFGQAFGAARKAGAKDFTWKGKKYAVTMAPKQAATPNPAGTVKNAAGGLTTTNAGGAATSVTRNSRPVAPGSLRAQQQANQAAQPVKESYMKDLNAMRRIAGLKDSGT
jgi:hypothetical protein